MSEEAMANQQQQATVLPAPVPPVGLLHHDQSNIETEEKGAATGHAKESRQEAIGRLARTFTKLSTNVSVHEGHPLQHPGTALDPHSENFNYRTWAKTVLKLQKEQTGSDRPTAGFSFRNLSVHGYGSPLDYQKTLETVWIQAAGYLRNIISGRRNKIQILTDFDGLVQAGELLVVLGPPGSGCSTLLKSITGETKGIYRDEQSFINYHGVSVKDMHSRFKGEAIYTAEVDVHFPQLSVGDTLYFAARARAPRLPPGGVTQHQWAEHRRDVIMAVFGISHTINTRVGNDFVRGVSGGERKRVSLAEATLSDAPLQAWDNSTRGLDSANAIEFCKNLKLGAEILGSTAAVAIYQAPQSAYDCFDKATVLYEGHQIYFGSSKTAKQYFVNLGFECPTRQTEPDFLTSMCSPEERRVRQGFENKVPRTPEEFARAWKASPEYAQLCRDIEQYNQEHPIGGESSAAFVSARRSQQAKQTRAKSPFTLSYTQQIKLCIWRSYQRVKGDPTLIISQIFGNAVMALIVSSIFYNLQPFTGYFYSFNALLFFALLLAAFGSALEILMLYAQRPIVEKQARYAFYHPSAEAWASMLADIPNKILNTIGTSIIYYFMTNLRREPGPFFFYLFTAFTTLMTMSMLFRFIGSASRTLLQALVPTAVLILMLVIYTGFAINVSNMKPFMRWLHYIDIVYYGFEAVMINQYAGRNFGCSQFIPSGPGYENVPANSRICSVVGAAAGAETVSGDDYLRLAYGFLPSHKWRNIGILWAFTVGLLIAYMVAAETVLAKKSKGEVLVFRRGNVPRPAKQRKDVESDEKGNLRPTSSSASSKTINVIKQTASFSWSNLRYEIKIKGESRVILDNVDGWVVPGKITALMGVSGAGKTTLLDVLASRTTMGVVTGEILVDGKQRDKAFQRKTGYVQQQDLHLETTTVREALNFAALLRQPADVSRQDKLAYVDEVIRLLEMETYADAVVGVPGEGLNVEQRKRLTIGVELAAKPELLLFLDEPTSGLDSQTSWSILDLLEKLAQAGQSIIIVAHQPSAMLFERFDRLLLLAKGGRTVYFGEIGPQARTMTDYFLRNGASECPSNANPAEYMLEAIGAAPGTHTDIDWPAIWRDSPEYGDVQKDLAKRRTVNANGENIQSAVAYRPFAVGYRQQFKEAMLRVWVQYWRTPTYIYAKLALCAASALFISLSFLNAGTSLAGLQNQLFAIFALFTIFSQFGNQLMPSFVVQRGLYESRERASKTYSWPVFMLINILVEMPWNLLAATLTYALWFWPIYNQTKPSAERAALMWLYFVEFFVYASTFFHMLIAAIESAEAAGNIASLLFSLALVFNGVLRPPDQLPRFWIFLYRASPFTYLLSGMISVAVADQPVVCSAVEYLKLQPPTGQTCGQYLSEYASTYGGYLLDENATADCSFCSASSTNSFLASISASYGDRWRNFGIMWAYIVFQIAAAIFFYWLGRVPKKKQIKE